MNLVDLFHDSCNTHPEKPAVILENAEYPYTVLHRKIHGLTERLLSSGIKSGDFVILWMENGIEFIISYYAILHTGAVVIPVDPLFTPRETLFIVQNAQSRFLLTTPLLHPAADAVKSQIPDLEIIQIDPDLPDGKLDEPIKINSNENTLAKIIYTSGTTGVPKGAMLTHGNLIANIQSVNVALHIAKDERLICILPLFHSFAAMVCMLTPLSIGATSVVLKQFRPDTTLRAVEKYKITILCAVPSMFLVMAKIDPSIQFDLSSIKYLVSGGAGLPPKIGEVFQQRFGIPIHEGYGLSEAAPVVAVNPLGGKRKIGSIGLPIEGVEVKIMNEQGNELPTSEIGELAVRGGNVMQGYLGLPEDTELALRNGWLYTGDMGKKDEEGYIYIVDRKKEMILVRGQNVYPREVENVLYMHPGVAECAAVAEPDTRSGEVVRAVIVPKEQDQLTTKEIQDFCRDKLAPYKIPKIVDFVVSIPKTSTGKILRRALVTPK
jgi:long-chain acyl-CoA synthetase